MSTRSRIGLVRENGEVISIYCHFDGYPEGVGLKLIENYTDKDKVIDLMKLGSISSLCSTLEETEKESYFTRGEEKNIYFSFSKEDILENTKRDVFEEYLYLFENGKWQGYERIFLAGKNGDIKAIDIENWSEDE
jgi:hypothetical protein